jgi:hypothetical protein
VSSFSTLKKTLPQNLSQLTDLELILLLRWKPMNAPKGMNLWGLYLGTGRNHPVCIYTCPRTGAKTNTQVSIGKPSLLEVQNQLYNQPELIHWIKNQSK